MDILLEGKTPLFDNVRETNEIGGRCVLQGKGYGREEKESVVREREKELLRREEKL